MDAHEATAQLKAARDLGQRLSDAASAQGAQALTSHHGGQALEATTKAIDPSQDGQHTAALNGQANTHDPQGARTGTTPVSRFDQPHVVLDTPAALLQASDADLAHLAGQDLSWVAQGDVQHSAAHTSQLISAETTSLYTHQGGLQIKAANGKVSLRAHTDELKLQAQDAIQVLSVNGEIRIQAKDKIELIGADSSLVLEGGNITMSTPGSWAAKGAIKQMMGGGSKAANLNALPEGAAQMPTDTLEIAHAYHDQETLAGAPYEAKLSNGQVMRGTLDATGSARISGVPAGSLAEVRIGPMPGAYAPKDTQATPSHTATPGAQAIDALLDSYTGGQA
jgi:type VI secretion system secreted protein VgrG